MSGSLIVITGPMWSGKTTELLRQYDRKTHAKVKCLLVKHGIDNRYSDEDIVTHTNTYGLHTKGSAKTYSTIEEIIKYLNQAESKSEPESEPKGISTIFIDEIQFFPDKHMCLDLLDAGIDVVVAGLNGDYKRTMFQGMDILFAAASDIKMLTAVCGSCQKEGACYTARIAVSDSDNNIDVGGSDKYMAVCPSCYLHGP